MEIIIFKNNFTEINKEKISFHLYKSRKQFNWFQTRFREKQKVRKKRKERNMKEKQNEKREKNSVGPIKQHIISIK